MPFTNDDYLPSYEELTVPELELTSSALRAASVHFGKYCDNASKEFMLCTEECRDPRKCINEGKEVTRCGFEFFGKVKKNCLEEFNQYFKCIDHAGSTMDLSQCRKTQAPFDACMTEKMGIERPDLGYFSLTRVHKTDRPQPKLRPMKLPEIPPGPEDIKYKGGKVTEPFPWMLY